MLTSGLIIRLHPATTTDLYTFDIGAQFPNSFSVLLITNMRYLLISFWNEVTSSWATCNTNDVKMINYYCAWGRHSNYDAHLSHKFCSLIIDKVLSISYILDEFGERLFERGSIEFQIVAQSFGQHEHFLRLICHWCDQILLIRSQMQCLIFQTDANITDIRIRRYLIGGFDQFTGNFIQVAMRNFFVQLKYVKMVWFMVVRNIVFQCHSLTLSVNLSTSKFFNSDCASLLMASSTRIVIFGTCTLFTNSCNCTSTWKRLGYSRISAMSKWLFNFSTWNRCAGKNNNVLNNFLGLCLCVPCKWSHFDGMIQSLGTFAMDPYSMQCVTSYAVSWAIVRSDRWLDRNNWIFDPHSDCCLRIMESFD